MIFPSDANSQDYLYLNPEYVIVKVDESTVKFKGTFSEGSGMMLVMALTSFSFDKLVLESNGGLMLEAMMLGKLLNTTDIEVLIEKDTLCVSACAFAAMSSEKITLDGKLVFHAPYYPTIPTEDSLYTVFKNVSLMTIELADWFLETGYSVSFLELIYENTNNDTFMVFESIEDLESFKTGEPSLLPENYSEKYKLMEDDVIFK